MDIDKIIDKLNSDKLILKNKIKIIEEKIMYFRLSLITCKQGFR